MGADADDQRRALLVGHQHRHVLARPGERAAPCARAPGRAAARGPARGHRERRGRSARRRSAAPRRRPVHVAEDHVGRHPLLEHPVGAAVDGDHQRPHVADVGAQRLAGPGGGGRRERRSGRGGRGSWPASAGTRRCRSAGRSPRAHGRPCSRRIGQRLVDRSRWRSKRRSSSSTPSARPRRSGSPPMSTVRPRSQPVAVVEQVERARHRRRRSGGSRRGPAAAARRSDSGRRWSREALITARDAGCDQLLGGDPVDVDVVDDRDLAGAQPLDQVLGPPAKPHRALDHRAWRSRRCDARAEREATATGGCHRSG